MHRRIPHRQIKVDPFGDQVLNQKLLTGQGRLIDIAVNADIPRAALGGNRQMQRQNTSARALIGQQFAGKLDPVRAGHNRRQRQIGNRLGLAVARQRGGVNRVAGAISAPVGGHENINRR